MRQTQVCNILTVPGTFTLSALPGRPDSHARENFIHGSNGQVELFIPVIEMRGHTHARIRPPVDQNATLEQRFADFFRVWHLNGHSAPALLRIARCTYLPTALIAKRNQAFRLPFVFFADVLPTHLTHNLQSWDCLLPPSH